MSRAGKFIPGGGGGSASGKTPSSDKRTGPIRAPDPAAPPDPAGGGGGKKPFKGLVKPVNKNQRMPIAIMSGITCIVLVSVGWYTLAYLPAIRDRDAIRKHIDELQQQLDAQMKKAEEERVKAAQVKQDIRSTLTIDTNPSGATVTIGDFRKTAPAQFTDLIPGTFSVLITLNGYEDVKQEATVTADKPNTDLGTITLVQKSGNLSITSPQSDVTYKVTGGSDYEHEGQVPDKIQGLPIGNYTITVNQKDWQLPPVAVTIKDHDDLTKEIKFPYANVVLSSTPPGATVRDGRTVLGTGSNGTSTGTPLTLSNIRPRDMHLTLDLPPYTIQRIDLHVPDFGNVNKQVTLKQDKDFIAACGMPMVWIPEGGYWAGKYLVRQIDFETAGGNEQSSFRRPTRPVDSITWESANAFCDQLTQYEKKAGKLPAGYHYALPKEAQWEQFSADANIDLAATSRNTTLSATQDVGYSEPNKYGLYDTIGNVWEWCADTDDKGNHSVRGGCWLSSIADFANAETRNIVAPKYTDRFTGFRVVLVPN